MIPKVNRVRYTLKVVHRNSAVAKTNQADKISIREKSLMLVPTLVINEYSITI